MIFSELSSELEKLKSNENYAIRLGQDIRNAEPKRAKEAYEIAIEYVIENNMLTCAYPWFLYNLGWLYYDLTDFKAAITLFEDAYEIFDSNNNIEGKLATISAFVSGYSVQQKHSTAIDMGLLGIELASKEARYERLVQIKNNLAALYMEITEYEKAKRLLDQIESSPYVLSTSLKMACYMNLAECCTNLGDLDQAIKYISRAYDISKVHCPKMVPNVMKEIANIYAKKGWYALAEEKFSESVSLAKEAGSELYMQDALFYWADLEITLGKYQSAIDKLDIILKRILDTNSIRYLSEVYSNLALAYKGLEDYKSALNYMEKYSEVEKNLQKLHKAESMEMLDRKREEEERSIYKLLYEQTQSMYSVGQKVLSVLNKEDIFEIAFTEISKLIPTDAVQIVLYDEDEKIYKNEMVAENGKIMSLPPLPIEKDSFCNYCLVNNEEIFISDVTSEYSRYLANFDAYLNRMKNAQKSIQDHMPHSLIILPLLMNEKVIGALSVQAYKKDAFSLKDLSTLKIFSSYLEIGLQNARLYQDVEYASKYDDLTKVFNRRELFERAKDMFDETKNKNASTLCVLMVDLDHFKLINDKFSHQSGDYVLSSVANVIQDSVGPDDLVGRYGGEEFMLIIPNQSSKTCFDKAEQIRTNIEKLQINSKEGQPIRITASLGGAIMNTKNHSLEHIISYADNELYLAKNTGRNRVSMYK